MKNLLLLFFMVATFSVSAQKVQVAEGARLQTATDNVNKRLFDGTESLEGRTIRKSIHQIYAEQGAQTNGLNKEEWIGSTYYDLQSNGSGQNRVHAEDADNIRAVWTHHGQTEDSGFPQRGTGFNETVNAASFGQDDGLKLEASSRTGWPNITTLDDGTDVAVCHLPAVVNQLVMLRRAPGSTDWVETTIPTVVPSGLLWPQIASVGNTIHMICVSTPTGNDGAVYEGLNPALLYFRSDDGGDSWVISDKIIDGLGAPDANTTNDLNGGIGGDSYQLVADGDYVAIGVFDLSEDILLVKSNDGGNSWEKKTVSALPFDDFTFSTLPYTVEDLGGIDPLGPGEGNPDSLSAAALSFLTSDGSGAVALDGNGVAHVVFPQMYVSCADTTQAAGAFTFFPLFGNLIYWNECTDSLARMDIVVNALDTNGDTTLNFADFNNLANHNGNMFIGMPSLEILEDNRMVLSYAAAMEELIRDDPTNANPLQHYTHVWMTGSSDAGATWTEPLDVINTELSLFGFLVGTTDAVFPNMHVVSGNQVALTYMFDDEPGLNLVDDEMDPITANTITMMTIDVEEILGLTDGGTLLCELSVGTTVVTPETFGFDVTPNPAAGLTTVNFELDQRENVTIDLYNIVGALVSQVNLGNTSIGVHNQNLALDNLAAGIYMVSLRAGDKVATQKLVVTK